MPYTLISFGHKYGVPPADLIVMVTGLRNPYNVPNLRALSGVHPKVQRHVMLAPYAVQKMRHTLSKCLEMGSGRVAIGCYGGRHRSVTFVELLTRALRERGHEVNVEHRDLGRREA